MSALRRELSAWRQTGAKLVEIFGADLRSLAIFRIVLGLLVLVSLAVRATDLVAFYSDQGVLPRAELVEATTFLSPYFFSLGLLNGKSEFQILLFGIAALAALAMLVGYRTRLATFVAWLLVLSIQFRNPLTLNGGDYLLHLLLFWSVFLPLGAIWSVDRARLNARQPRRLSMQFFSMATVALFLQIAFVYWFTALLKTGESWRDGTALYYTFSNDQLTTQLGPYLLNFPALLTVMTFATVALEALGPFLLFSPIFTGVVRTAAVPVFMSLHFGILLTLEIGIFPWISALPMVCFLPGWFWDRVFPKLRPALPGQPDVVGRGKQHLGDAATYVVRSYVRPLWTWLSSPVGTGQPQVLGLTAYGDYPVNNSPGNDAGGEAVEQEERRSAAGEPGTVTLRSSRAVNLLALFFMLYVFSWNVTTVSPLSVPSPAYQIGPFLGLFQSWEMFAPSPPKKMAGG